MSSTNHTASETIKKAIVSDDKAGPIALPPTKRLAILTCMDARINPFSQLGIEIGEAHIIRNAGGVARDALRSLIISQRLLGTREIAKLVKDADPGNVQAAKQIDDIDFLEYGPDLHKSVLDDVQFLKDSPLILKGTKITVHVLSSPMSHIHSIDFAKNNEQYAATFDKGHLPLPPSKKIIFVTCMDARVEPAGQLGIGLGEAHVIRNAGGLAKDALRSIVISQRLLGTREIALFHHTGCGMLTFTDPQLKDIVKDAAPGNAAVASAVDAINFGPFSELEASVKADVQFLKENPLLLEGTKITGWIYEVETGQTNPHGLDVSEYQDDTVITPQEEASLSKLSVISPPQSGPVIAVDLDDVLSQTNHVVAEYHNEVYGTNMDISHFYYYYYWKNPFWGTPAETFQKVKQFYTTDRIHQAQPVPGAREGIQTLRDMGYRLIIVTARTSDVAEPSWKWVDQHFPGLFDSLICTNQFKDENKVGHEVVTKLSKGQVCNDLGARLLIDDSAENAIQCSTHDPPTRVLLFGDYQWNKRTSGPSDYRDEMSFDIRLKAEGGREFWKEEALEIPKDAPWFAESESNAPVNAQRPIYTNAQTKCFNLKFTECHPDILQRILPTSITRRPPSNDSKTFLLLLQAKFYWTDPIDKSSNRNVGEGALDDSDSSPEEDVHVAVVSSEDETTSTPLLSPAVTSNRFPVHPSPLSQIAGKHRWTEDEGDADMESEEDGTPSPQSTDTESDGSSSPKRRVSVSRVRRSSAHYKSRSRSSTVASLAAPQLMRPLIKHDSQSSIRTVTKGDVSFREQGPPSAVLPDSAPAALNNGHRNVSATHSFAEASHDDVNSEQLSARRFDIVDAEEKKFREIAKDALVQAVESYADEGDVQMCAMMALIAPEELGISAKRAARFIDAYIGTDLFYLSCL
ncbi:hypothetical protein ONZ45_g18301 [Pleurotus djamor]|nr:hypothetical protein ONZ45_g18301 [Pleurotus djamor]